MYLQYLVGENALTSQTSSWEATRGCWVFRKERVMLEERAVCVWHSDVSEDIQTWWTSLKKQLFALSSREHLNKGFVLMNIICQDFGWDCNRMHVCCAYGCRYCIFLLPCIYLLLYLMVLVYLLIPWFALILCLCLYIQCLDLSLECMNTVECIMNSCYIFLYIGNSIIDESVYTKI